PSIDRLVGPYSLPTNNHIVVAKERKDYLLKHRVALQFHGAELCLATWKATFPDTQVKERIASGLQHIQCRLHHRLINALLAPFGFNEPAFAFDALGEVCLYAGDGYTGGKGQVIEVLIGLLVLVAGVCEDGLQVYSWLHLLELNYPNPRVDVPVLVPVERYP
ncbi:hypothetical protein ALP71_00665, partial [Pseudomonas coronafaciens pv. garcae]